VVPTPSVIENTADPIVDEVVETSSDAVVFEDTSADNQVIDNPETESKDSSEENKA